MTSTSRAWCVRMAQGRCGVWALPARAAAAACLLLASAASGQSTSDSPLAPPPNGMRRVEPGLHALVGGTVHPRPGESIENGVVVVDGGRIVAVGPAAGIALPQGARVWRCEGLHVYAGFIDAHLPVEAPAPADGDPGAHWSELVTPQRSALHGPGLSNDDKAELHELGFVAAAIAPEGGVFGGSAAVVSLAPTPSDASVAQPEVYRDMAYQVCAFETGSRGEGYPTSQMGSIALMRQSLSDADWLERSGQADDEAPQCLDALAAARGVPLGFRTDNELEALRALKIAEEFDRPVLVVGSGVEFRRLAALAEWAEQRDAALVIPLTMPKTPEVGSVGAADAVDLRTLLTWEQAPTNARRLHDAGLTVALTTSGARRDESFADNLTRAMEVGGLSAAAALEMLTTAPASVLGMEDQLGRITRGHRASLVVASGDLFDADARSGADAPEVRDLWIDGVRYEINAPEPPELDGDWALTVGDFFSMSLRFDGGELHFGDAEHQGEARKVEIGRDGRVSFLVDDPDGGESTYVLTGALAPDGARMTGAGLDPRGEAFQWTAVRDESAAGLVGEWSATLSGRFELELEIERDGIGWEVEISEEKADDEDVEQDAESVRVERGELTFEFDHEPFGMPGVFTMRGRLGDDDRLTGTGTRADGEAFEWVAVRAEEDDDDDEEESHDEGDDDAADERPPEALPGMPFGAFAIAGLPEQASVLIEGATIWTSGPGGVIQRGWVRLQDGTIAALGSGAAPASARRGARVIDGAGLHVTPGIIDAHSHTGISGGVNEAGQAVSAEVRIGDVTNPDAMNWYRQLAGGVTAVNSMHGSANPIGGQTQTTKLRWGVEHPDDMHMEGATPGIKFALGENVKQANWGDDFTTRYPQTRMGVETTFRDRFNAAREYAAGGGDLRRDLELDALAEILAGERLIHCHSYRQDEILMLCEVAREYGFTIGSFQHGLEVYKVAEHVREVALGASLFSDWWAYKFEVFDAIPHAGPLQTAVGVNTSYNSDSDELARRMHVEAAKAVKYSDGRLSEEEALKFITINPAIQLGIADRVGSIEAGKDADVAVWSGPPLSSFSRCVATFVDGREFFSLERDAELREANAAHRHRVIQKILAEGRSEREDAGAGEADEPAAPPSGGAWGGLASGRAMPLAERMRREGVRDHYYNLLLRGIDPETHRCGDCGMTDLHFGAWR